MPKLKILLSITLLFVFGSSLSAQNDDRQSKPDKPNQRTQKNAQQNKKYPPEIKSSSSEVYKSVGGVELRVWIFNPTKMEANTKLPAAVFFFGGGWRSGSPTQFVPHCQHLAKQGMVGIVADYRVSSRHNTRMTACVEDAKSAIRWTRKNADRLGIDPNRIAAGGGSAGGHLAASTALLKGFDSELDDQSVSCRPDALLLFNPALVLAPVEGQDFFDEARVQRMRNAAGVDPETVSPFHQIRADLPPTIIFHGKADKTVPYVTAALFNDRMNQEGNRCELKGYEGQGHGFFNFRNGQEYFRKTVSEMDRFLQTIDFLESDSNVKK